MVYIDLLIGLNFAVDLLLILATNALAGYPQSYGRAVAAAALGGIYGGICILPDLGFLSGTLWRIVFLVIMASIAYGWNWSAVRRGTLMILLSMALGGIASGMNKMSAPALIASAAGLFSVCFLGMHGQTEKRYAKVELTLNGQRRTVMALHDTGNTLHDPISGLPVLVVSGDVAFGLVQLDQQQLQSPMETMLQKPGFRLIPFRSVGCSAGMLLAKRPEEVRINGRKWDCLVAFAPQSLGNDGYEALAGGMVV